MGKQALAKINDGWPLLEGGLMTIITFDAMCGINLVWLLERDILINILPCVPRRYKQYQIYTKSKKLGQMTSWK